MMPFKIQVEGQLKSAIQSHFVSINTCMEQLKDVNKRLTEVREALCSIEDDSKTLGNLEKSLYDLRVEAVKFKQLKSANENVANILSVDDLAKQAAQFIDENKILLAHKCLLDIEKCRNDILEDLGPPNDNSANIADIKVT